MVLAKLDLSKMNPYACVEPRLNRERCLIMDPYVYMAYLCFLEGGSLNKAFNEWKRTRTGYVSLPMQIENAAWTMKAKAKQLYIFELEQSWEKFRTDDFLKFLDEHGFIK